MTERKRLPYAARGSLENAEAKLREGSTVIRDLGTVIRSDQGAALVAHLGMLIAEARLELRDIQVEKEE